MLMKCKNQISSFILQFRQGGVTLKLSYSEKILVPCWNEKLVFIMVFRIDGCSYHYAHQRQVCMKIMRKATSQSG